MNKPPREFNKESARLILAALKFSAFREQSIEMENKLLDDRDVNAIIYYIEKRHVELEAYDQLKKENEELIYKNWALKNAYDNVDDKNTQLKSLCQRLENVLENVKSKIEYHSQAYALDIMSDDGRKPCTTTAGRMGRHMCKVFGDYLSEALKGEES